MLQGPRHPEQSATPTNNNFKFRINNYTSHCLNMLFKLQGLQVEVILHTINCNTMLSSRHIIVVYVTPGISRYSCFNIIIICVWGVEVALKQTHNEQTFGINNIPAEIVPHCYNFIIQSSDL